MNWLLLHLLILEGTTLVQLIGKLLIIFWKWRYLLTQLYNLIILVKEFLLLITGRSLNDINSSLQIEQPGLIVIDHILNLCIILLLRLWCWILEVAVDVLIFGACRLVSLDLLFQSNDFPILLAQLNFKFPSYSFSLYNCIGLSILHFSKTIR